MSSSRLLFAPPHGIEYQDNDWKILCRHTPIPLYEIPDYFIDKSLVPDLEPPVLWCGWAVGEAKLLELAQLRYPEHVSVSIDGEIIVTTLFRMEEEIRKEFQIPEGMHDCVLATNFTFPNGHVDYGLVVGNNIMGIIPPTTGIIDRIAEAFFEGESPGWYLAPKSWRWTQKRRSRRVRSSQ